MTTAISRASHASASSAHAAAKRGSDEAGVTGFESLFAALAATSSTVPAANAREHRNASADDAARESDGKNPPIEEGALGATSGATIASTTVAAAPDATAHAHNSALPLGAALPALPVATQNPLVGTSAANGNFAAAASQNDARPQKPPSSRPEPLPTINIDRLADEANASKRKIEPATAQITGDAAPAAKALSARDASARMADQPGVIDLRSALVPQQKAESPRADVASKATTAPDIIDQFVRALGTRTIASRAQVELSRQRQFALANGTNDLRTAQNPTLTAQTAPEQNALATLVALGKADATGGNGSATASGAADTATPIALGAWSGTDSSTSQTVGSAIPLAPSKTFDQAAWSEALARHVTAAAIAETRETSVRLDPKGLGLIEVRVSVDAHRVDVRFAIEHPITAGMVRDALPQLESLLAQSGMTLGQASVAQQQSGGNGNGAANESDHVARNGSRPGDEVLDVAVEAAKPRMRLGLLDDFV